MSTSVNSRRSFTSSLVKDQKRRLTIAAATARVGLGAIALAAGSVPAIAADQYWDTNGATAGAGAAGVAPGTWDTSTNNWTSNSAGSSATTTYVSDNATIPVFSAGADATGVYSIILTTGVNAGGIRVEEGNISIINGNTINLADGSTVNVAANSSLSIGPDGLTGINVNNLVKTGNGTLTIASGSASSLGNSVTVSAGTLQAGNAITTPTDSILPNNVVVASGANLVFRDSGASGVTFTGSTNGLPTTGAINYGGQISGGGNVSFVNPSFSSSNYRLNNNSNYTGSSTLVRSSLTLYDGGKLSGTSAINVRLASVLFLDDTGTNDNNRINDAATLNLQGGVFQITGKSDADSSETIGTLNLGVGGQNYVTLESAARTADAFGTTLTVSSLTRDLGGAMLLRGNVVGSTTATGVNGTNLKITNTAGLLVGAGAVGTSTRGIIPGVYVETRAAGVAVSYGIGSSSTTAQAGLFGNAATLSTYDVNGVRALNTNEYSTTLAANVNLAPGANVPVTTSTAINALEFGGAGTAAATAGRVVTISAGQTLTINSGTILSNSTSASSIVGDTTGTATLSAGAAGASSLFVHNTTAMTLGSTVAGALSVQMASLTKDGQGALTLASGTTVTNTGPTYINQGALIVNANNQLGTSVVVGSVGQALNNGTIGQANGSLQLAGNVSYNLPLTLSGQYDATTSSTNQGALFNSSGNNTWSGNIALTGTGVNSGDRLQQFIGAASGSTLTLSGVISSNTQSGGSPQSTGLVFGNAGTVVLTGAPNTFGGLSRQYGGTVIVEKDAAFGIANQLAVDDNVIQNGGVANNVIAFRGGVNYTTEEWIFTNQNSDPFGTNAPGLIDSIGGNNKFAGHLALGNAGTGSATVGPLGLNRVSVSSDSLELSGSLWQQGNGTRILEKTGPGELIISADSSGNSGPTNSFAQNFSGGSALLVTGGTVRLRGDGMLPNQFSNNVINAGGLLVWDDSQGANANRLNGQELDLNGGEFRYTAAPAGSSLTPSNVRIGGMSFVSATTSGAGATTLDIHDADRQNNSMRGTLVVGAGSTTSTLGNAIVKLSTNNFYGDDSNAGTTRKILPWVLGDATLSGPGTDFVTVDGSGNARRLVAADYGSLTSGASTLVNANVASPATVSSNTTVNSLKISSGGSVAINPAATLTVNSGAILNASGAAQTISGGSLSFSNEAVLWTPVGNDMTIASNITNGNGLTKTGAGNLTLTGANSFGGQVTIDSGALLVPNDTALGQSGNQVYLSGGNLAFTGSGTFSSSRSFNLTSFANNFYLANTGTIDFGSTHATTSGSFQANGFFTLQVGNGGNLVVNGNINNNGQGTVTLNVGDATTGGGTMTVNNSINLSSPSYLTINVRGPGSNAVFNGELNGMAANVFAVDAGSTATFTNNINGGSVLAANVSGSMLVTGHLNHPGSLVKNNTGTLTLVPDNNYTGATTVNSGTIIIPAASALGNPAAALSLPGGGQVQFSQDMTLAKPITVTGTGATFGLDVPTRITVKYQDDPNTTTVISGAGKLVKTGGGTLIVGNQGSQNSYTGGTLIAGGVLEYVANANGTSTAGLPSNTALAAGYWQIANNATLRFNEGTNNAAYSNTNRTILVSTGGGTVDITALTASQSNAGLLGSTTLTKAGPGTFVLTSNNTSFTGKIAVAEGTLSLGNDNNLGPAGSSVVPDKLSLADGTTLATTAAVTLGANRGISLGAGTANITPGSGFALSVAGPISGGNAASTLNLNSSGAASPITLSGANTFASATNVTSGKVVFGSSLTTSASLTVADGAAAQITAGNNKVLKFGTVNLNSTGQLDMTDERLILTGSSATTLRNYLASGYAAGSWNGAGINSSTAAANASKTTGIGWALASDLGVNAWGGVTGLTGTELLTRYTYFGDANLSGKVDADDYVRIDRGMAKGLTGWFNGDFNYDGSINSADYALIDRVYIQQGAALSADFLAARESQFGPEYVSSLLASVPEPSLLGLLAVLPTLATRRRRAR